MTPLRKSGKTYRIVRLGHKPPIRPGNTPPDNRCPLLGEPLAWLERYNEKIRSEEAYKLKCE